MATIATTYNAGVRALCRGRRATRTGDYALPRLFARWRIATRPRFHLAGARQNGPTSAKSLGELACARFGARLHNAARCSFDRPDPLAEKYYAINPYVYCAADPINHLDPTGCAIKYNSENEEDLNEICKRWQKMVGECATIAITNGIIEYSNYDVSKGSRSQQEMAKQLKSMVDDEETAEMNVVHSDTDTLIGNVETANIDLDDMDAMGEIVENGELFTLAHETVEQYEKQVKKSSNKEAHTKATKVENYVPGGSGRYLTLPNEYQTTKSVTGTFIYTPASPHKDPSIPYDTTPKTIDIRTINGNIKR